jgi:hypothetical protein
MSQHSGNRGPSPEANGEYAAVVEAQCALLGLTLTAEMRPGVLMYFALAAQMARQVEGFPLAAADEAANVFRPVPPMGDESADAPAGTATGGAA